MVEDASPTTGASKRQIKFCFRTGSGNRYSLSVMFITSSFFCSREYIGSFVPKNKSRLRWLADTKRKNPFDIVPQELLDGL